MTLDGPPDRRYGACQQAADVTPAEAKRMPDLVALVGGRPCVASAPHDRRAAVSDWQISFRSPR
jgi:hypothetical protein